MPKKVWTTFQILGFELQKAISANQACVNKLLKYEKRGYAEKAAAQIILCAQSRLRVCAAWDAIRLASKDSDET